LKKLFGLIVIIICVHRYNESCVDKSDILCGLSFIYDLIKMRQYIDAKHQVVRAIQKNEWTILQTALEEFEQQNLSLNFFSMVGSDEISSTLVDNSSYVPKGIPVLLQEYIKKTNQCMDNLNRIFSKILASEQPSLHSQRLFNAFLTDLDLANFTIHFFCKKTATLLRPGKR